MVARLMKVSFSSDARRSGVYFVVEGEKGQPVDELVVTDLSWFPGKEPWEDFIARLQQQADTQALKAHGTGG